MDRLGVAEHTLWLLLLGLRAHLALKLGFLSICTERADLCFVLTQATALKRLLSSAQLARISAQQSRA